MNYITATCSTITLAPSHTHIPPTPYHFTRLNYVNAVCSTTFSHALHLCYKLKHHILFQDTHPHTWTPLTQATNHFYPHELHHCYVFNHRILVHYAYNFCNPLHFHPNLVQQLCPAQRNTTEDSDADMLQERKDGSAVHHNAVSHSNALLFSLPGPPEHRTDHIFLMGSSQLQIYIKWNRTTQNMHTSIGTVITERFSALEAHLLLLLQ